MKRCTGACMDGRYPCPHEKHCGKSKDSVGDVIADLVGFAFIVLACFAFFQVITSAQW